MNRRPGRWHDIALVLALAGLLAALGALGIGVLGTSDVPSRAVPASPENTHFPARQALPPEPAVPE
jgi:hypothetical protein